MSTGPIALVLGASGQTGSLLAAKLASDGRRVVAVTRGTAADAARNWRVAGVPASVEHRQCDYLDVEAITAMIEELRPSEIYVLCGQSSVRRSFELPLETIRSHILPVTHILEAVRTLGAGSKVVYAGSVECFGRPRERADESEPFDARSPYAAGKVAGSVIVRTYRESFGLACCTAFLSNHESALRGENFVFGKVLSGLQRIVDLQANEVVTGPLGIQGDFGYAPEFAAGLAAMGAGACMTDLILATGKTVLLRDAIHALFHHFGVDPATHLVETGLSHSRVPDVFAGWDISRARGAIDWRPGLVFPELASRLADDWSAARALDDGSQSFC